MNPLLLLLLLPIVEIAIFIEVGGLIGGWPTVGLILLSGIAGTLLLRRQGLAVLKRAQASAERGELPVGAVFEGFCVVVAGILLMVPGFLTDLVGILLFVPPVRDAMGRWLLERIRGTAGMQVWVNGQDLRDRGRDRGRPPPPPGVIDVDYREVDPDPPVEGDGPRLTESRWGSRTDRP